MLAVYSRFRRTGRPVPTYGATPMPIPVMSSFSGEEPLGGGKKGLKSKKNSKSKMGLKGSNLNVGATVVCQGNQGLWVGDITQANPGQTVAMAILDCKQPSRSSMKEPRETETVTV